MIRCKYLKGRPLADCLSIKGSSSCVWKGIAYVWDGADALFWTDSWVLNVGPLLPYALRELDLNQLSKEMYDFFFEKVWNCNLLCDNVVFAWVLWYLWKWRCCKVFEENFCTPLDPNKVIMGAVKEWIHSCKKDETNIDNKIPLNSLAATL
ncbi:hypothetical protein ACOSP7_026811 [Xanthoceras sorbifolium]